MLLIIRIRQRNINYLEYRIKALIILGEPLTPTIRCI